MNFIWINHHQQAFEWFVDMLTQLETEMQATQDEEFRNFLHMDMYMTGAATMNDLKVSET